MVFDDCGDFLLGHLVNRALLSVHPLSAVYALGSRLALGAALTGRPVLTGMAPSTEISFLALRTLAALDAVFAVLPTFAWRPDVTRTAPLARNACRPSPPWRSGCTDFTLVPVSATHAGRASRTDLALLPVRAASAVFASRPRCTIFASHTSDSIFATPTRGADGTCSPIGSSLARCACCACRPRRTHKAVRAVFAVFSIVAIFPVLAVLALKVVVQVHLDDRRDLLIRQLVHRALLSIHPLGTHLTFCTRLALGTFYTRHPPGATLTDHAPGAPFAGHARITGQARSTGGTCVAGGALLPCGAVPTTRPEGTIFACDPVRAVVTPLTGSTRSACASSLPRDPPGTSSARRSCLATSTHLPCLALLARSAYVAVRALVAGSTREALLPRGACLARTAVFAGPARGSLLARGAGVPWSTRLPRHTVCAVAARTPRSPVAARFAGRTLLSGCARSAWRAASSCIAS